jgi:hypothetical protein
MILWRWKKVFIFSFIPFLEIDDEITNQEDVWEVIGIF